MGFEYDYDRMDNILFERFAHDNGLFDHFLYNDRYEVIGVEYRAPRATPPANPRTRFFYDDVFNRTQASFGDPFEAQVDTLDNYTTNKANEYTQIRRNGRSIDLTHDRAGNMTRLLVQPVTNGARRSDALATARWDAFNLLFDIDAGVTPKQDYRYDPFRRRIVTLELGGPDGGEIQPGSRRYIYCGWDDVEERLFDKGATLGTAPSRLERIYVNGRQIDEPLLAAIDSNGDRQLGISVPKNIPDPQADQEYYFLNNRLGSIMALLDANRADRVLEYYRYTVYGAATVLPVIDVGGNGGEATPRDLADNLNPNAKRFWPAFGNVRLFTARRFDARTGLYYYRNRYYEPCLGRFVSRDPAGYSGHNVSLYPYVNSNPQNDVDPLGLWDTEGLLAEYAKVYGEENMEQLLLLMAAGIKIDGKCSWVDDWWIEGNTIFLATTWWFGSERPNSNAAAQLNEALVKVFGLGSRDWSTVFGDVVKGGLKIGGGVIAVKAGLAISVGTGGLAFAVGWGLGITGGSSVVEGATQIFGIGGPSGYNPSAELANQLFGDTGETVYRLVDIGVNLYGAGSSLLKISNLQKYKVVAKVEKVHKGGQSVNVHHLTEAGARVPTLRENPQHTIQMTGHLIQAVSAAGSIGGSR